MSAAAQHPELEAYPEAAKDISSSSLENGHATTVHSDGHLVKSGTVNGDGEDTTTTATAGGLNGDLPSEKSTSSASSSSDAATTAAVVRGDGKVVKEVGNGNGNGHGDSDGRTRVVGRFMSSQWITGAVKKDHGDLVLLAHSFVTGLVDAGSFSNWGVFCGMQTGNTVILGLSSSTIPSNPHAWLTTLVSLASFLIGAFLTFRLTLHFVPRGIASSRLYLASTLLFQALLIIIAAALVVPPNLVPHKPAGQDSDAISQEIIRNVKIVALLPPLAFQSGMQIATSRLLGFNELPVNVLTSTYCDLMGDSALFGINNVKRNRRVVAVVLVLAGAISAGWLMRSSAGLMGVLWLAGGLKFVVAVFSFFFLGREVVVVKKV